MFSTSGRRRLLTDAQVLRIIEWQRMRKTLIQVARENGVSPTTIYKVIEEGERYKKSAPPSRQEARGRRNYTRKADGERR